MNYLTLHDLRLALEDLLAVDGQRLRAIAATKSWALYGAEVKKKGKEIISLLDASGKSKQKFTEELSEADKTHDGFGGAFWHLTEAYLRAPDTTKEQRELMLLLRSTFMAGGLAELKASFSDEAARAKSRLPLLETHKDVLRSVPLLHGTLFHWMEQFLRNGVSLSSLMSERSMAEVVSNEPERAFASSLRGTAIGVVKSLRNALQFEMTQDPTLPKNLDSLVFEYFDQLDERRQAAIHNAAQPTPPAPPATPSTDNNDPK